MALIQIVPTNLEELAVGTPTLLLVESEGFSADGRLMLVKATYIDSGDSTNQLHYATYLFDTKTETFIDSINGIVGDSAIRNYDVKSAKVVGSHTDYTIAAMAQVKGLSTSSLVIIKNGVVTETDLFANTFGFEVVLENYVLSDDGKFLAIQTSNSQLADDIYPDTNDASDIYLIELATSIVTRVSMVGGAEVTEDVILKDVFIDGSGISVAFVTDAAFVSPSSVDINSSDLNAPAGARTDAYVWHSSLDASGSISGTASFTLASKNTDGQASGYVLADSAVLIHDEGVYFSSNAADLVGTDDNESVDAFANVNGVITRLSQFSGAELSSGATLGGLVGDNILLLSDSPEISGSSLTGQLYQTNFSGTDSSLVSTSVAGQLGDNLTYAVDGSVNGGMIAFTSLATNLTTEEASASQGSLYLSKPDGIDISGIVYHWSSQSLLEGVRAVVNGNDQVESTSSNVNGFFELTTSIDVGHFGLTKDVTEHDANRHVTSNDALAALKIAVGINPNPFISEISSALDVSPYQLIAADINNDGRVTSADALAILKMAVGLPDALDLSWAFVREDEAFRNETNTAFTIDKNSVVYDADPIDIQSLTTNNQNYVGVLMGDVNGSWSPESDVNPVLEKSYFQPFVDNELAVFEQWFIA